MFRYYITKKTPLDHPECPTATLHTYGINGTEFNCIPDRVIGYIELSEELHEEVAKRYSMYRGDIPSYFPISEETARRAKEAYSFSDYIQGTATECYKMEVDNVFHVAYTQKKCVDPMYHNKIDSLAMKYARLLAANINAENSNTASCPSIMIAGGSNFPVRKKEKQNARSRTLLDEYNQIQGIVAKIRSVGTGGISSDDPDAIDKLKAKLELLEKAQQVMKDVNAYYRKNKTLDGCTAISAEQIEQLKSDMSTSYRIENKPFASYALSNNNAEIRRIKGRIEELKKRRNEAPAKGWEFDGGEVVINTAENRLQILFDEKPDADLRTTLKGYGFRWAPSQGAWQRQLTDNAIRAARALVPEGSTK